MINISTYSRELEAFLEYLAVVKLSNSKTIGAYEGDISSMERFLSKPAISFDLKDIVKYLSNFDKQTTKNRKLSALNSFYKFCLKSNYLDEKPAIELGKLEKKIPKYLRFDSIMKKLETIDRDSILGKRDYAFILFLYASGARVSEALSLKREDFDGEWVKFLNSKRDKQRVVPVAKVALEAIDEYQKELKSNSEFIWLNYQGKKLSRISAFKIVKKYLGVYPHALRHSYATELILGGADLRVVQELLGHSSLITTSIYTHIENSELRESVYRYHPMAKEEDERYSKVSTYKKDYPKKG